jgi:hypothetical protein
LVALITFDLDIPVIVTISLRVISSFLGSGVAFGLVMFYYFSGRDRQWVPGGYD